MPLSVAQTLHRLLHREKLSVLGSGFVQEPQAVDSQLRCTAGSTIEEVIDKELASGPYGRCVYHCDNDVADHQVLNMELENQTTISFVANAFTLDDFRSTHIKMTYGEIDGDETTLRVRKFRGGEVQVFDFSDLIGKPFHAGADLNIIDDFLDAIADNNRNELRTTIEQSVDSHVVCYEAENSRLTGKTIFLK